MKRRDVIKNLTILPASTALLGAAIPVGTMMTSCASSTVKRDLFGELGIPTFINCVGTITAFTGSVMHDEVLEAIKTTSQEFCLLDDVQDKVGEKIAKLVHSEAATVTAGCWSAMILGTAGILTGMDKDKVAQLPNLEGMKSEIITQKTHNHTYIKAVKNTGVTITEIETVEELENAISEKTAMMFFLNYAAPNGKITHEEWVALGKKHNIPTMIDMAADVPPVENLWKYNDMGFDLVCISGGKGLRGPQSAGILMGKKDLIAAARLSAPPRGGLGRGMKVNKEEIFGMYVALEKYINTDHEAENKMWEERIAVIENAAKEVAGVSSSITVPPIANHTPVLSISWDTEKVKITGKEMIEALISGSPAIKVNGGENHVSVAPWMMLSGQEKIVATRIKEELVKATA
jgi:L-seryl-tRNA(Ser) seleniumtransferase